MTEARKRSFYLTDVPLDEAYRRFWDALDRDALEVYVPGWFKDLAANKAQNVQQFLSGTAEWVRTHK